MTTQHIIVFAILLTALVLFIWGRWRHDIVAFAALVAAVLGGLVPAKDAFDGFGHPAVITVALVLILSRALQRSGDIDWLAALLARLNERPALQLGALTGVAGALSGFMNNVGALALLMPIGLQMKIPPARVLMPLSFAAILGGLVTMIGTPPNIIIAAYRAETTGAGFALFDFAPIGVPLALAGLAFLLLVGRRLIPDRQGRKSAEDLFDVKSYITEIAVPEECPLIGQPTREIESLTEAEVVVIGLVRGERRMFGPLRAERLRAGDVLIVRADAADLEKLVADQGLAVAGAISSAREDLRSEETALAEAVIAPNSRIEGWTPRGLRLRRRYGVSLLALAREGRPFRERLSRVNLKAGDVMLLQGDAETLAETIAALGALPLASRDLQLGRRKGLPLALIGFAAAILVTILGLLPIYAAFAVAVVALTMIGVISPRDLYEAVDWPVIVLLAAMIPIGGAMEASGTTALVASAIVAGLAGFAPVVLLGAVLVVTMTLSDLMNNAATAVVMAPIAAGIAERLAVSADPFLMATAIGASCAFLTPIGHQNNLLVMGPGGYRFGDYWRLGLPLEILIVAISLPLLLTVWPLSP